MFVTDCHYWTQKDTTSSRIITTLCVSLLSLFISFSNICVCDQKREISEIFHLSLTHFTRTWILFPFLDFTSCFPRCGCPLSFTSSSSLHFLLSSESLSAFQWLWLSTSRQRQLEQQPLPFQIPKSLPLEEYHELSSCLMFKIFNILSPSPFLTSHENVEQRYLGRNWICYPFPSILHRLNRFSASLLLHSLLVSISEWEIWAFWTLKGRRNRQGERVETGEIKVGNDEEQS